MDQLHSDHPPTAGASDIAVIGLAGRFPRAQTIAAFWENLCVGVEGVTFFSEQEALAAGADPQAVRSPAYVRAGAALEHADLFDANFFGFLPLLAQVTDPQQRLFLECAWEALEQAGYISPAYQGAIGVFGGVSTSDYGRRAAASPGLHARLGTLPILIGNDKDFLATQVSYKLDLRGPSLTVQTACSTGLVAVHLACQSLLNNECDIALAGAASIREELKAGYLYASGGIFSPDGRCRAFDAQAQGTVMGDGVGVVALKLLAQAQADGDTIYAVIKGSAINNDGARKAGFTAPSVDGQAAAIAEALAVAGVDPATIGYIEAHGTGTALGDPLEAAALTQVFGARPGATPTCALGSVKTNIGHLDVAAGIAGLIKAILALQHGQIPPNLHFRSANPQIDFAHSRFYVPTALTCWPVSDGPRRAGVSSFGIGGSNAHVVLEEAPPPPESAPGRPAQLLILSAKTPTALERAATDLHDYLAQHPESSLADAAYTLQVGRRNFDYRRALVARDHAEALQRLAARDPQQALTAQAPPGQPPIVFLFPGQGAQYVQMAAGLYQSEPLFRAEIDRCAALLEATLGHDLRATLYPAPDQAETAAAQLQQTAIAQPALFVVEYALARLWISWGVQPWAMIGHSVGEYVAATLAGVFSLEEALGLVAARGALMQSLPTGAMLSVPLGADQLQALLDEMPTLALAAINAPTSSVAAGPHAAIDWLEQRLNERSVASRRLRTSHAFHSAMMDPILESFAAQVAKVRLSAPRLPFISNVSGDWITSAEAADPGYWVRHLRATVRFSDGLCNVARRPGHVLLEVGPGQLLGALVRLHPKIAAQQTVVQSLRRSQDQLDDCTRLMLTLGQLWLAGVSIDWSALYGEERRRRLPLPTYPFERQRYNISQEASPASLPASAALPTSIDLPGEEMAVPPATTSSSVRTSRSGTIAAELKTIVGRLSGMAPETIPADVSFLELGFDSLLMIQVNQAIQEAFAVKVSLIQMLEQLTNLQTLAEYIDRQLPAEDAAPAPAPQQATPAPMSVAAPPAPTPAFVASDAPAAPPSPPQEALSQIASPAAADVSALQSLFAQQIHLLSQQIDALRAASGSHAAPQPRPSAPQLSQPPAPPIVAAVQAATPRASGAAASTTPRALIQTEPYMPYKPLELGQRGELTPRQQQHLDALIGGYVARTSESKRLTQAYRPFLADSRSTARFRLMWKEIVYPLVADRARGSKIWDVDGNEYVDLTMGFGLHLFGHAPDFIVAALEAQTRSSMALGPQLPATFEVAQLISELAGVERVNFCNSGTEAVMGAIRVARTVTRRTKIALFAGSYHGWSDLTMTKVIQRDGQRRSAPLAPGVSPQTVEDVLVLDYTTPEALDTLRAHAHELAAVLVEPVQSRRPDIQPRAFLHQLREITAQAGVALIFDEMVTGFRIHPGGAQHYFGVQADLVIYGKVLGGGLALGIVAGKAAFMDAFDGGMWRYGDDSYPEANKTLFAGAFFKHPLTMASAKAILLHMREAGPQLHEALNARTARMVEQLNAYLERVQAPIVVVHFGSLFRFTFAPEIKYSDIFFFHLLTKGIYIWEGGNCFLSTAHTEADIERIIRAVIETVEEMQAGEFLPPEPLPSPRQRDGADRQELRRALAGLPGHESTTYAGNGARSASNGREQPAPTAPLRATLQPARVQFSLYYFGNYPAAADRHKYDLLFEGARFADQHGFAAIWLPERHFHSFGGFSPNPAVLAAALARETSRLQLRAGSVALPLHHPIRVAEEWATVDNLAHGRIGVSFASGWHPNDFVFAPDAYADRRAVMEQSIRTVQRLWRGGSITLPNGKREPVTVQLFPQPVQAELPIWLTCVHDETFVRAGRLGLGVLTNLQIQTIDELAQKIALYRQARATHGHDPAAGNVTVLIHAFLGPDREQAIQQARQPFFDYMKASIGLRNLVESQDVRVDWEKLSDEDLEYLLTDAYDRYVRERALIGTPDSCAPIVERLVASGVDEIGCLIDFGIETAAALAGLPHLQALKTRAQTVVATQPLPSLSAPSDADAAEQTFPLTEAQQELWVLSQLDEDAARSCNESVVLRLLGPLNQVALEAAFQAVVDRHEVLRTTFSADGERQSVMAALKLDAPLLDLTALDPTQQAKETAAWRAELVGRAFDLLHGPLLRVELVKLAPQEHLLGLTIHHIVTDGWSLGVILREISALYEANCRGGVAPLPQPAPFREFLALLDQRQRDGSRHADEQYWLSEFADAAPILDLPSDAPRPAVRTYLGARQQYKLDPALGPALQRLGAQHGCTLLMTLLASFNVLLHRLSGQDDLVVGLPAAGQLMMERPALIGYCVNLLPIRSTIRDRQTFVDYLAATRSRLLGAYQHQAYPISALARQLNLARDASRPPLVSVAFNMERVGAGLSLHGLTVTADVNREGYSKYDISLEALEHDGRLTLDCYYNTALFTSATIVRWLANFEALLAAIVADPQQPLRQLPLLTAAERHELLVARNATAAPYPRTLAFHDLVAAQVARTPDAIAVQAGPATLTYAALDARATALARHLRAQGVGLGDRVALYATRTLDLVVALLGIFKAGAAFVPLDPGFPAERLAYILADAQVRLVLTQAAIVASLPPTDAPALLLDQIEASAPADTAALPTTPAEALAYIIYTSGSTGRPKGVLIPHRGLVNYLVWCVDAYGAASGRGAPVHASIAADAIFPSLFAPLLVGKRVLILPETQGLEALTDALQHDGPFSLVKITPSQLEVLTQQLPHTHVSGWVNTFVVGAEEVRGETLHFWQQHAPATVLLNEYGPTETVVGCSIYRLPPTPLHGSVPIGLPIANTQFYVLDAQLQPVPLGVPGELYIGGDGVAWGYLGRPALTAERFVPDPFSPTPGARLYKTGDLVRPLADRAANLVFLGRLDDQVKLRGYRVEPGEVAEVLRQHEQVREAVVLARADGAGDLRLVAYVVAAPALRSAAAVRTYLAQTLPEYMLPSAVVFLDALPLAPHGKIDRAALPAPDAARPELESTFIAPRTPLEQLIAETWQQVLNVERVGVEDNFFELGGDSLRIIQIVSRVRDALQIELLPRRLFEYPTVAHMALLAAEQLGSGEDSMELEDLVAQLETLTDEEIAALLADETGLLQERETYE